VAGRAFDFGLRITFFFCFALIRRRKINVFVDLIARKTVFNAPPIEAGDSSAIRG
jgi:hypothetical protein